MKTLERRAKTSELQRLRKAQVGVPAGLAAPPASSSPVLLLLDADFIPGSFTRPFQSFFVFVLNFVITIFIISSTVCLILAITFN